MTATPARLAILVPTLDEERTIVACLTSLVAAAGDALAEILVLDGGSRDATRALVERFAATSPVDVRLLDNPDRLQAAACNLGARAATPAATVLVRADAHAVYPPGFAERCAAALAEHDGATSVVVPMRTAAEPGGGHLQRAIAATQNSRLGNGGAGHRTGGGDGWVEHGHHAAFDRAFFRRIGGYRPDLATNEDAELDHRAHRHGGRVWMCADAVVGYHPRRGLRSLARQYARFGAGRARTGLGHGVPLRTRQLAPLAILAGCAGGIVLAPWRRGASVVPLGYAVGCCTWGGVCAARRHDAALLAMGPAAMTMHLAWAVGFVWAAGGRPWATADDAPPGALR